MGNHWLGKTFIGSGTAMFIGNVGDSNIHSHYAIQIVITLDQAFEVTDQYNIKIQSKGIIIPSNLPHKISTTKTTTLAVAYIEPDSKLGKKVMMKKNIDPQAFYPLSNNHLNDCTRKIITAIEKNNLNKNSIIDFLSPFEVTKQNNTYKDCRVDAAINYIKTNIAEPFLLEDISSQLSISSRYLRVIFEKQVGMSMQRYRLWQRLFIAIQCISQGMDFTDAAHAAYFTDSAHFSKTFRTMFGLSPSKILKNTPVIS